MRVAICDDNEIFLEEIKKEFVEKQEIKEVHVYSEINRLFRAIEDGEKYDVLFLDIDWGETNNTGLELGEKFYRLMPQVPVVLMTGYNDRFAQRILLHKINLVGYLTKPIDSNLLAQYLNKIKGKMKSIEYLNVSIQGTVVRLETEQIRHIESHNHQIHIYTNKVKYIVYEKLSDILKRLPDTFVQCHKSFLVNLEYVEALEGKEVLLNDGKRISISRSYQNHIKDRFFAYIGEMI